MATALPHQQTISSVSATSGGHVFAGVVYGDVTFEGTTTSGSQQAQPKAFSTVPFRRDDDFVDRGDTLAQIHERCSQPGGRAALVGLGGVGKSQLAIEYAYQVRDRSPETWVFWVNASNEARFEASYHEIAERLALPRRHDSAANVLEIVFNWLSNECTGQWLMIIDNVDFDVVDTHRETFEAYISETSLVPQSSNGAVLITSRSTDVGREIMGREEDIIRVGAMSSNEAAHLLHNKLMRPPEDSQELEQLLAALEYFPLAITQAAAYINQIPSLSPSKYLRLFHDIESEARLLGRATTDLRRDVTASNSILATWQISFEHIRSHQPSAADLLAFLSFFNPQGIPHSLLQDYSSTWSGLDEDEERDVEGNLSVEPGLDNDDGESDLERNLSTLESYSMVTMNQNSGTFGMHRLVRLATTTWLRSIGEEDKWRRTFLSTMSKAFPTGEFENWSQCRLLLPHVESLLGQEPTDAKEATQWAQILHNAAWFSRSQGLYIQAQEMAKGSMLARTRILGLGSVGTLDTMSILASVLQDQGKYKDAEHMNRQALEEYEKVLGKDHPKTLKCESNLAAVLRDRGKNEEAERMSRAVLKGREKVLGIEHPGTLTSASNLAGVLLYSGKYSEAEEMNRHVLDVSEKTLGIGNPDTLTRVSNLAVVLQYCGKYSEAETMNRQALRRRKEVLGTEHPDTLTSVSNLAVVLQCCGKYSEAEQLNRQALEGRQHVLGTEHPDTLMSISNLALVLQCWGKYSEAEKMNRRALEGRENELGSGHPDTLMSVNNLALLLHYLGKYSEAEKMNRRALDKREKVQGKNHPDTLASVANLALIYWSQGRWKEAEELNRQAVQSRREVLGAEHPDTLSSMANLATTQRSQGQWKEAEDLEVSVMQSRQRLLGAEHPDTLASMANLATTQRFQGRWREAEELGLEVMQRRKELLGDEHPDTLSSMNGLALTYQSQGQLHKAEELEMQVVEIQTRIFGLEHPDTLSCMSNLASIYWLQKRWDKAENLQKRVLATNQRLLGKEHPDTISCISSLASTYLDKGLWREAEQLDLDAMKMREVILGKKHPETLISMNNLSRTYHSQSRWDEAEKLSQDVCDMMTQVLGTDHPLTLGAMAGLAQTWWRKGETEKAISLLDVCVRYREKVLGPEHSATIASANALAKWQGQTKAGAIAPNTHSPNEALGGNVYETVYHEPNSSNNVSSPGPVQYEVLIMSSDPRNTDHHRLGTERRELEAAIRDTRLQSAFSLHDIHSCRIQDITRALDKYKPSILHFSGHGDSSGIYFERDDGLAVVVDKAALAALLGTQEGLNLVILNACFSQEQAQAIADAVGYVVGMEGSIIDEDAISFSREFYRALGDGRSVEAAFERARVAVGLASTLKPHILKRSL